MSGTKFFEDDATAGFTLIEVLVALAILAVSVMSIGSLAASNMRGVQAIREHVALVSVARAIETRLPDFLTDQLGPMTGTTDGHAWRVDFTPFNASGLPVRPSRIWVPQEVAITVTGPTGERLRLNTIRLRRGAER